MIDLDSPVPCGFCGTAFVWTEHKDTEEDGTPLPSGWSARCPKCDNEWNDVPILPTWRTFSSADKNYSGAYVDALIAEIDALRARLEEK